MKWDNSEAFDHLHLYKHLWVLQVLQIRFCRNGWICGIVALKWEGLSAQEPPEPTKDTKGAVGCWRERLGHFLDAASPWEGAGGVHCFHSQEGWSQKMSSHHVRKEMEREEVAEGWDSLGCQEVSGSLATQLSLCLLCVFCVIFK